MRTEARPVWIRLGNRLHAVVMISLITALFPLLSGLFIAGLAALLTTGREVSSFLLGFCGLWSARLIHEIGHVLAMGTWARPAGIYGVVPFTALRLEMAFTGETISKCKLGLIYSGGSIANFLCAVVAGIGFFYTGQTLLLIVFLANVVSGIVNLTPVGFGFTDGSCLLLLFRSSPIKGGDEFV